ncbi:S-adenosyl-L-methionine-dependent methyltransferase [Byssothecium circinans]|uniref:S-adenosyl-L-methionine-dependent methyltransferase n=1 Tax=Byssothecium circinans TaxID=147558 RepID=A0A6A5TY18_9PLEO|nr:S-adenosyl-L-methionine-dependent methyltransferase [Byssothecium circinans]
MARGRGGARGGGRKPFHKGKNNRSGGRDVRTESWSDIKRENETFKSYYELGGFLEPEEFKEMWERLAKDLPNSFRFTGTKAEALAVRKILIERYIPAITAMKFEGQPVEPPRPVKAFADDLVWDMKTDKKIVRRHAPFADFQKFLVTEAASGNISRQEVVSMIPPHFLAVKPGMVVLDMCAAPGSKTAQLAEMIHGDEEERVRKAANGESPNSNDGGDYSDDGRSTGLLIANDTDYKRAGMLVHQVKRLNFPNLIVTQHDASIYPSIELPTKEGEKKQYLKFDRILADVPCSGDGTARKNPGVWSKWTPKDGLGLHNLQLRILFRGIQMLKKGGRLVYSTCSMNPTENEAVVAAAIKACGGVSKVQLVDCHRQLPNLKRKPGLNTWKVMDTSYALGTKEPAYHMFTSWDNFAKTKFKYDHSDQPRQFSNKIVPECFPPVAASEAERIPLERCVRVYPHMQDTGAFFIAVLEKIDDVKVSQIRSSNNEEDLKLAWAASQFGATSEVESADKSNGEAASGESSHLKRKLEEKGDDVDTGKRVRVEDALAEPVASSVQHLPKPATNGSTPQPAPVKFNSEQQTQNKEYFEYLPADDPNITKLLDFFGISDRFPRDRFMVKNKEGLPLNKVYYTSALAKSIINQNKYRGMKFVHCGVIMFVAHKASKDRELAAPWRLQNEGIRILEPWANKRIVHCTSKATLYKLLIEMFPILPKDGAHNIGEVGDQLLQMDIGCTFVRIEQSEGEDGFPFRMVLPLWRHPGSANLMVDKDDRKAMLLRFFNEKNPTIINHVADKAKAKAEEEAKKEEEEDQTMEDATAEAVEGEGDGDSDEGAKVNEGVEMVVDA